MGVTVGVGVELGVTVGDGSWCPCRQIRAVAPFGASQ